MPTIRQMYGGLYSLYKRQYSNGQLFNSKQKSSETSSILNNYSSSSYMSELKSLNSNAKSLISTYDKTKKTFNAEFDDTLSNLKDSSNKIKYYDFNVGENAVTKTENINEDGEKNTVTSYNDKLTDALKTVENFLSDYNDTIKFFSDNCSVSKRVGNMAKTFGDTTYRSSIYNSIGIVTAKDGTMKIDEDKLVDAITSNPDKVSRILGKGGLAGKADNHLSFATSQKARLFPSLTSAMGNNIKGGIYSGNSLIRMSSYASIGNFLNMWI